MCSPAGRPPTASTTSTARCLAGVEALAGEVYDWRRYRDDPKSYWIGSHHAADLFGVSCQRLGQLGDKGSVPFVRHRDVTRLYRRQQQATVANSRGSRRQN